jgi:surface antigen
MKLKAILNVAVGAAMAVGMGAITAPAAQAASRDGVCDAGEFCYFYNSNLTGSLSDFTGSVSDYGTNPATCYVFKSAGSGRGVCIKNNAASVWNRSSVPVTVYFNSGFGGASQVFTAGASGNLNSTLKNNEASHKFGTSGGVTYPVGNDYPYRGATSGVDPWNFYKGQCTSFAAWTVNSRLGIAFSNSYKGQHWGNAINWDNAARAAGISVTGTPRPGDVAVRNSGTYGHVAFVTSVRSDGTYEIDEYNHVTPYTYSHRVTTIGTGSNQFDSFIHFKG